MDILALLQPIEDRLSPTTLRQMSQVIVYARFGVGWSFGTPEGQTYQEEAEDVHTLVQKAGIQGPISWSGIHMVVQ